VEEQKNFPGDNVTQLVQLLKPLSESYRLLVGAADEFNKITLAHKKDLSDAIHRADDLGEIIDKLIKTLDTLLSKELRRLKYEDKDQEEQIGCLDE